MKKFLTVFLALGIFGALSLSAQNIDWINGGTLPQPNGGGNVPNPSGPSSDNHQGTSNHSSGNHANNSNNYPDQPKPDGTPYPGYPHVVWTGNGYVRPETGYDWKIPGDAIASKYKVVPLPLGTPYPGYPHVVWNGDGKNIRPAEGYRWENHNNPGASDYRVVPITVKEQIAAILPGALRASKNRLIRNWIVKLDCQFSDRAADAGMISPWVGDNCLIFTESFLEETKATRENLIVFEAGKLFFATMKDKDSKGETLEKWFTDYTGRHRSMIMDMKNARSKDQNEDFPMIGDREQESMFGYVFRMQALQLDKPKNRQERHEWNKALREFRTHVNPLLRGK
jgi:hypothetical protein